MVPVLLSNECSVPRIVAWMLQHGSGGATEHLTVGLVLPSCFLLGCFTLGHLAALRFAPLATQGRTTAGQLRRSPERHPLEIQTGAGDSTEASKAKTESGRPDSTQSREALSEHTEQSSYHKSSAPPAVQPSNIVHQAVERMRLCVKGVAETSGCALCAAGIAWWMSRGGGGPTQLHSFVAVGLLATLGAVARWRMSVLNLHFKIGTLHSSSHFCKPHLEQCA